jgi:hypothetical protein
MSDNKTENSGYKSPGTRLREGLAVRRKDIGKVETNGETESARAEGEALKAQQTTTMVQRIMRCTAEVMVHKQDLADAKAGEVAAQQGLAEAQLRVPEPRQELADGIQIGLLIKVRTALVEEALVTTVIRNKEPASKETCVARIKQSPVPSTITKATKPGPISREYTLGELCLQAIVKAGLNTGLPECEKKSCTWDLQL